MSAEARQRWEQVSALPRLGWVAEPSPITTLPEMAERLGLAWLGVKRDDQIAELFGSTKVRKLDFLLASPEFVDARSWSSAGAIGSGHLVALAAAAAELGRELDTHVFWEPPSDDVIENLAYVASHSTTMHYYDRRFGLALRSPRVLLGGKLRSGVAIEPGATNAPGMAGLVRGALEVAAQLEAEDLAPPDRLVVPVGSGGTIAGLILGLGLAGLRTRVHGVAVVERPFATRRRIEALIDTARTWMVAHGIDCGEMSLPEFELDRTQLGRGYGIASPASLEAVQTLRGLDLPFEAVYSGKGIAAILARPPPGERVLYWLTPRRAGSLPSSGGWRESLPWRLRTRLRTGRPVGRRAFIVGALAAAAIAGRCACRPEAEGWSGEVLASWQAAVLACVSEAILPPGPARDGVPAAADRYLGSLPEDTLLDLSWAMDFVEQGPPLLAVGVSKMSALTPDDRRRYLDALSVSGGMYTRAYRAVRDLCMLGYYQRADAWAPLDYAGPLVGDERRADRYAQLRAEVGARPRGFSAEAT